MQKHISETTDVEWVPQNLIQIPVQMGNSYHLDFQHSFVGEKAMGSYHMVWAEAPLCPGNEFSSVNEN